MVSNANESLLIKAYPRFNGFLFSNKNYIPQGNNIRENLYNPCSKNSVGKTNTFKANTDSTD